MNKAVRVGSLLFCFCAFLGAAGSDHTFPSFRNDVIPVLTKAGCNSGACHGSLAGKNGFKLSLRGYDPESDYQVLTREASGRRVVKTAPAHSLILLKPTLTLSHGGGKRFDTGSQEYQIVADWIASGTPPPSSLDPVVEQVMLTPARTLVEKPGRQFQLTVTASYSDGTRKDVTRWAKFVSTDEGVALVDPKGVVVAKNYGEAAISVWYSSKVSFARVTIPYPNLLRSAIFEKAPKNNYIDELVLKKLKELRIAPSALSNDHEFVRRVFLDALGILPTLEEVERFVSDRRDDKRQKLVEEVIRRPEFVDYWSYKWSDLLLVSSRKLDRTAMHAYYQWIRNSVAANKPWDRFVYELVTATGSTLKNGAANYWVIHKDPIAATENLSQAFLGISLTCARCHNHPLEKWTQDQYYSMANLLSRVSLKTRELPGDVTVISTRLGEIDHPRRNKPMAPQPPEGEPLALDSTVDRRLHLAQWLTSSQNSHFARTVVNRVWANFFGRGLVEPVDDLRATNPASNEELFAALTVDFVKHGFDVQYLIRTILNSAAYQLSSKTNETNVHDEKYYSHYLVRRLPAEVILDALSQITEVPEQFQGYPSGVRALQLPDTAIESYFLESFGRPPRITSDESERMNESNVAQVLHLINGDTLNRKLRREGNIIDRLLKSPNASAENLVDRIYKMCLSRPPSSAEVAQLAPALEDPNRNSLEDFLWAVLTRKEFLFKH